VTDEPDEVDVKRGERELDLILDAMRVTGGGCVRLAKGTLDPTTAYADASTDILEINDWLNAGDGAGLVSKGPKRQVIALDWEHERKKGTDGLAAREELRSVLGDFRTRGTYSPNGGRHDLFWLPLGSRVRPAQNVLRGLGVAVPGLDIVTTLIRPAGTPGYTIADESPIARLPDAWLDAIEDRPEPPRLIRQRETTDAAKVLQLAADDVAALGAGRSEALNAAAYRFAGTDLSDQTIEEVLMRAAETNGSVAKRGRRACVSIIRGGIRARGRKGRAA
jgi:hypothetical protein